MQHDFCCVIQLVGVGEHENELSNTCIPYCKANIWVIASPHILCRDVQMLRRGLWLSHHITTYLCSDFTRYTNMLKVNTTSLNVTK